MRRGFPPRKIGTPGRVAGLLEAAHQLGGAEGNGEAEREPRGFHLIELLQPLPKPGDLYPDRGVGLGIEIRLAAEHVNGQSVLLARLALVFPEVRQEAAESGRLPERSTLENPAEAQLYRIWLLGSCRGFRTGTWLILAFTQAPAPHRGDDCITSGLRPEKRWGRLRGGGKVQVLAHSLEQLLPTQKHTAIGPDASCQPVQRDRDEHVPSGERSYKLVL